MPSASFGGGSVRVRAPRGYDASAASDRADRDLPGGGAGRGPAGGAGRGPAHRRLRGRRTNRPDATAGSRSGRPCAGQPARHGDARRRRPAGHDAVVLLERDGLYSWHLPLGAAERTPVDRARAPNRVLRALGPARAPPPSATAVPRARRTLGQMPTEGCSGTSRTAPSRPSCSASPHRSSSARSSSTSSRACAPGSSTSPGGTLDAWRPVDTLGGGRPPHRPGGARPAARPRHVLVDDRGLRGARRRRPGPRASSTRSCRRTTPSSASTTAP